MLRRLAKPVGVGVWESKHAIAHVYMTQSLLRRFTGSRVGVLGL